MVNVSGAKEAQPLRQSRKPMSPCAGTWIDDIQRSNQLISAFLQPLDNHVLRNLPEFKRKEWVLFREETDLISTPFLKIKKLQVEIQFPASLPKTNTQKKEREKTSHQAYSAHILHSSN